MRKTIYGFLFWAFAVSFLFAPGPSRAASAPLPKSSVEMLKKFKLEPSILADIDKELEVPKDWMEKARKEGKVKFRSTPSTPEELKWLLGPFKERYPFIDAEYSGTDQEDRTVKTLVAHRAGRVLSDVLGSVGGYIHAYRESNALDSLRGIPNLKNVPEIAKDPDGFYVGMNVHYWCMAYNTKFVKKEELPKKWEDILNNPKWRGGNLALGNRPQLWALNLWKSKGESWTKDYMTRLITEVKPQIRKEGLNALVDLLAAGEFHAVFPALDARAQQKVEIGAPVGFTCPEPAPVAPEDLMILRGAANPYAARVLVNWLLSKEGQIAYYAAKFYVPVHKDLQRRELLLFPDDLLGKEISYRDPILERDVNPKLIEFWNGLVLRGGRGR